MAEAENVQHAEPGQRRSGSQLTAAQRARKRANDREAQRNIRKRTKDHIAALESKLIDERQQNGMLREKIAELEDRLRRSSSREAPLHHRRPLPRSCGPPTTTAGDNSPRGLATLAWVAHPGIESWTTTAAYVPTLPATVSTYESALPSLSLTTPTFPAPQGPPVTAYSARGHLLNESETMGWASDSSAYDPYDYMSAASFNHSTPASATSYMTGSPYLPNEQEAPEPLGLAGPGQNFNSAR